MTGSRQPTQDLGTQVARLFFDRQMTKVEIGAHLGISRFRVARLIDSALAEGLVHIEYRDIPPEDRALATAMEERFGLDLCAVADVAEGTGDGGEGLLVVARLAGAVIDGLIGPSEVIGIAWGSTMAAVIREIPTRSATAIEVVQLAGSSSRIGREHDAGQLARSLTDRLGATNHPIYAPTFVASAQIRAALARDAEVGGAIQRFGDLTLAIIGIGAMPSATSEASSSLLRSGVLDDAEIARLVALGAVGDLLVHPFDAAGRFVAPDLAERAVAIGIDALRRVPRVVAVAVGSSKAAAIRGGLASGMVHILVTDRATARAVLVID